MPQGHPQISRLLHIPWIAAHYRYYLKLNGHILLRGVPIKELLILKYPLWFKDANQAPLLSVDITDACNLRCVYCNNPLFPYPRTMMSEDVFSSLIKRLRQNPVNRIRISGGEPTLHPQFREMLLQMSRYCKYLSIITNGQWQSPDLGEQLLSSGVNLIELSLDAGGAAVYESSRPQASYKLFMSNLKQLYRLRNASKSKTLIKIRLMIRPSTRHCEKSDTGYLLKYSYCVLPQWVLQHPEAPAIEDVYSQNSVLTNSLPMCTVPFRDLQIRPDGRVPLCPAKGCSIDPQAQVFIGDICINTLPELWQAPLLKQIRAAHRSRKGDILSLCRNCHYG